RSHVSTSGRSSSSTGREGVLRSVRPSRRQFNIEVLSMEPDRSHSHVPDTSFDGGDLDCGNGLLLLIRQHIDPLGRGGLLEIRSTEISVDEDLPAWCRMTGNELVSWTKEGKQRSFLVCKGTLAERHKETRADTPIAGTQAPPITVPAVAGAALE